MIVITQKEDDSVMILRKKLQNITETNIAQLHVEEKVHIGIDRIETFSTSKYENQGRFYMC